MSSPAAGLAGSLDAAGATELLVGVGVAELSGCAAVVPAGELPVAELSAGAGIAELSPDGASERGAASLGGGAPLPTVSTETAFLSEPAAAGPIMARVACWTTSVALTGLGSTSVGSPTLVA